MKPAGARDVAYEVVRDVFGPEQRGAQAAFDVRARRAGIDARDRAFAAELAYGTIKGLRTIDWCLAPYLEGREKPLSPSIADVLRVGLYQVRFMSGVEDHAAVSETVNLAWKHGHKGTAGLVNAVLRRALADGAREPLREEFETEAAWAGVRYSVPTWIAAMFARAYGERADAALAGVNAAPQHALSVNPLRATVHDVIALLDAQGIAAVPSPIVAGSLLVERGTLSDDEAGRFWVQSESAAMPVDLLAPQPGESVLELCGGRGNKTLALAGCLRGEGSLVSIELDARKSEVTATRLQRAGLADVALVVGDARSAAPDVRADAVLLDAPCSGIGVIGRHPEARWRKRPDDGARLAELQDALLQAAAARTAPGGRLVYSVCSPDLREGRDRIDAFLGAHADFERARVPERYAAFERDGDVIVPAGIEGRDGFFIALLSRAR